MTPHDLRKNPFPGMNPYMESSWGDVHIGLIVGIGDALSETLPPDLTPRAEERTEQMLSWEDISICRDVHPVDVVISERWREGLPPIWQSENAQGGGLPVMEPEFVSCDVAEDMQRWLEIRDHKGLIVTVIEVLSPSNKERKRREYVERRQRFIETGANFVEIDLLRGGQATVMAAPSFDEGIEPAPYVVAVYRMTQPERFEVYGCGLRDRLPCFRVPLRAKDPDVPLDLQPLLDRIYVNGRYWLHDYTAPLTPSLSADDEQWARQRLSEAGLA